MATLPSQSTHYVGRQGHSFSKPRPRDTVTEEEGGAPLGAAARRGVGAEAVGGCSPVRAVPPEIQCVPAWPGCLDGWLACVCAACSESVRREWRVCGTVCAL